MESMIKNTESLLSHGNVLGRKALLEILEAGLQATDPYYNTRKLIRLEGKKLIVGGKKFEPEGDPHSGNAIYDLSKIENIYVFGAGKGIQRVAKAIEDTLAERITGGHIIDKKGGEPSILRKIGVTFGGHPIPDEDCVRGCEKIFEMTKRLTKNDLVFTCISNGVSSTLTMPVPDISLEDIKKTTYIMQIKHGASTQDLNSIRNHLDMMKGGRISRYIYPAQVVHIIARDPVTYNEIMYQNYWLHTLPDYTTFQLAIENLKKWDAWEEIPLAVREFLMKGDPKYETVKAKEFEKMPSRIFGIMPGYQFTTKFPAAMKKARELGFQPVLLTDELSGLEARHAGTYMAAICQTIERIGKPFKPPCALFTSGEVVVTVGNESGIGGRNQELALSAALKIAGSSNILIASVDTDGTDGPGTQFSTGITGMPHCLAGGIVDGETVSEANRAGFNINEEMKKHNTSPILWKLGNGIVSIPNISMLDFTVALVMRLNR